MAGIEKRQTKSGMRYRVTWRQDVNGIRRKQWMTFTDPTEALSFKRDVEAGGTDTWPPGYAPMEDLTGLTFGQWAERAIRNRTRATERTKADYRRDIERHFTRLRDVPLDRLNVDHVTDWLEDRRHAGLAGKTIRNLHGFASSLMVDALAQHPPLIAHNPFARRLSEAVAVRTEEMIFFTPAEFDLILSHMREEYRPLFRLLYGTGLRFGEATALTVGDIDLFGKRRTLTVTKAWKRTGPSEYVIGEPKTRRSRRTISLSDELVDLLIPLTAGRKADELLFCGPHGLRLPHSEVYKRGWAPAVARASVCAVHYEPQRDGRGKRPRLPAPCHCPGVLGKTPRIHDCRHAHVAALINEGVRLEVISRRLGHSSITITMDRYGHLDPSLDDAVNAAVDKALARRG